MPLPAGPFEMLATSKAASTPPAPLYLIPFDKKGRCEGPQTLAHLVEAARSGRFTDIHIFSHGWNNVFAEALGLYREFFTEYFTLRESAGVAGNGYAPLLVGILWPSTALITDSERGPQLAATALPGVRDAAAAEDTMALREVASEIADRDVERFHELAGLDRALSDAEALELATILMPVLGRTDRSGEEPDQQVTPEKLVKAWKKTSRDSAGSGSGAGAGAGSGQPSGPIGGPGALPVDGADPAVAIASTSPGPTSAGFFDFLKPREIVRKASVYLMKDRAGTVGTSGVGPMLQRLLQAGTARVHLTGHSYGAKVVLSALAALPPDARKVRSVLLLQPAVNHLCFADNVNGRKGGYRQVLDRCERPLFTTFSARDSALSTFFQLALRRDGDLAEIKIAATPSQFAALGGFGPGGLLDGEGRTLDIVAPTARYPQFDAGVKICALDGSNDKIQGHGDVRNAFTEWAQVELTLN
jgi:pimeloyl-ACP methyl ester carboxylesterase